MKTASSFKSGAAPRLVEADKKNALFACTWSPDSLPHLPAPRSEVSHTGRPALCYGDCNQQNSGKFKICQVIILFSSLYGQVASH
jgi:hypothetical protein